MVSAYESFYCNSLKGKANVVYMHVLLNTPCDTKSFRGRLHNISYGISLQSKSCSTDFGLKSWWGEELYLTSCKLLYNNLGNADERTLDGVAPRKDISSSQVYTTHYSINCPERLLNFWTLRMGVYSRWVLIRGWALIKFSSFSASISVFILQQNNKW